MSLLEKLTLKDNFMFGAVMIHPENCKPLLERILGISIERVTVSMEKSMIYHPEYKGVRLDIVAKDERHTHYNVEMQVVKKPALGKRSRYYHSQIDMELLISGKDYGELSDAFVIFICDFDPFGMGKYRYTFRNLCLEDHDMSLPDGCTTVFLNTHGTNEEEIPESLVTLLKYIGSDLAESQKDYGDPYIRQLQNAVRNIKASREMEAQYMLLEEMLKDEWKAGHEKGRAEGRTHDILELLSFKPGIISEELHTRILAQKDETILLQYLRAAYSANSVEEFERFLS